jgi:aryl-alcohol dehydrogenase-like predicted oxidoreductase
MWGGTDDAAAIRTIHAAVDEGVTLIDTAPLYGLGLAERLVGKAIRGRRDRVVLATKCGLVWHTDRGQYFLFPGWKHPGLIEAGWNACRIRPSIALHVAGIACV